jgi:predicted ferric reductase
MSSDPNVQQAVANTLADDVRLKKFESRAASLALWSLLLLLFAILLIVIGAFIHIKYRKTWMYAVWIVGVILLLIFAYLVYRQHTFISCMGDPTSGDCLSMIGESCGSSWF